MCYSLAASLSTGLGLGCIGTMLVKKAHVYNRKMLVYALFPVVFSIHQFIEGVNWYALEYPFKGDWFFLYGYSVIAFGFWPIMIPLAAAVAEHRDYWRKIWLLSVAVGMGLSAYLWIKLALAKGIDVSVIRHSLAYKPLFSDPPGIVVLAYVTLTTAPSIIIKIRQSTFLAGLFYAAFCYL